MTRRYCFVGERQSPTAFARDLHWQDWQLCAGTLARALMAAGLTPEQHMYVNLWSEPGVGRPRGAPNLEQVYRAYQEGLLLVALGRLAQRELLRVGLPHLFLYHPSARGAIRRQERYYEHVRAVLITGLEG